MVKKGYKNIDITFSVKNEIEMEMYKWIEEQGKVIGKSKYIKQLIFNKMQEGKATKK